MSRASWATCCSLPEDQLVRAAAQVRADDAAQRAKWASGFTRRSFLAGSGFVLASSLASQLVTTRYAYAAGTAPKTLVVVFLRGGLDGLTAVVPRGDVNYSHARPRTGIPDSQLLALDPRFGLHPSLSDVKSLWDNRSLAFVHAVGSTDTNRDHFASQSLLERGTTNLTISSGWLDRALELTGPGTTFRSVSEGPTTPRALVETTDTVAMQGLDSLVFSNPNQQVSAALNTLYTGLDSPMEDLMATTLTAVAAAGPIRRDSPPGPKNGAVYTGDDFGGALADIARLVRADCGLRVATVDVGGWDVHSDAGTFDFGTMSNHLKDLGRSLGAFAKDLGSRYSDVTLVCMSEFGRRVAENSSGGSDHGSGGLMMVMGGNVNGGQVAGAWPGLADQDLYGFGDLAPVNDYRNVLGEAAQKTLNLGNINNNLFPGYNPQGFGLLRA